MRAPPVASDPAPIAHGALVAPHVFTIEDVAVVTGAGSREEILAAARSCPAGAIVVADAETGEQMYP